jgi:phospholipid/cholesterol/gamma-HCH transport system substrate-binding protein
LLGESDAALAHAPEDLPAGLSATDGTLKDLRSVAEVLQTRGGKIAELVTALSQIASAAGEDDERLAGLAGDMHETLRVLASRDRELDATLARVPGFTTELRRATSSVQQLSGQLDPTLTTCVGRPAPSPTRCPGSTRPSGLWGDRRQGPTGGSRRTPGRG